MGRGGEYESRVRNKSRLCSRYFENIKVYKTFHRHCSNVEAIYKVRNKQSSLSLKSVQNNNENLINISEMIGNRVEDQDPAEKSSFQIFD